MDKKKIIEIIVPGAVVAALLGYALYTGIVSVNLNKTPYRDPETGQAITRQEFQKKTANDLYKDATEFNKNGNYGDAQAFLDEAIKKDKNQTNVNVLRELAVADYNLKKYSDAAEIYQKIIAIDPKDASAYNELGNVYRDMGDRQAAVENYKKSIVTDAGYVLAYNNLAMLYVSENDMQEAKNVIQSGLDKNPDSAELKSILNSLGDNK